MSNKRWAASVDANQPDIVAALRKMPGVTVQVAMEDILVGYNGNNYQIEIKDPNKTLNKDGRVTKDCFEKSQIKLMSEWCGSYHIAWSLADCIKIIEWNG